MMLACAATLVFVSSRAERRSALGLRFRQAVMIPTQLAKAER